MGLFLTVMHIYIFGGIILHKENWNMEIGEREMIKNGNCMMSAAILLF